MNYTKLASSATRADHLKFSTKHRADFARAAVFEEFRTRNARAIDYDGFRDRQPAHSGCGCD